jgi:Domain of unknown function (DUF4202)
MGTTIPDIQRFFTALRLFDEQNMQDPNVEEDKGALVPRELLNALRLSDRVSKLAPDASEELRLAARCQHICRWEIPRSTYPMDRAGYLKWRTELKKFHAKKSAEILLQAGYPDEMIIRVQELNLKKNFPHDPDSQVLEDALCLDFMEYQLADLAARTPEEKIVNALRKSWDKMSPNARHEALKINFDEKAKELVGKALETTA